MMHSDSLPETCHLQSPSLALSLILGEQHKLLQKSTVSSLSKDERWQLHYYLRAIVHYKELYCPVV